MSRKNDDNDMVNCAVYALIFAVILYLAIGIFWSFTAANVVLGVLGALVFVGVGYCIYLKLCSKQAEKDEYIQKALQKKPVILKDTAINEAQKQAETEQARSSPLTFNLSVSGSGINDKTKIELTSEGAILTNENGDTKLVIKEPETSKAQEERNYQSSIEYNERGKKLRHFVDDYCVIDIETTGLDRANDDIIELSALRVRDNVIVDTFTSLCRPHKPIPSFIIDMTGIYASEASKAPEISEVLPEFLRFVGKDILVGHNVSFDIEFIYNKSVRLCGKPFSNDSIDTLTMAHRYIDGVENYKLRNLAKKLFIEQGSENHRGLVDCNITYELYKIEQSCSTGSSFSPLSRFTEKGFVQNNDFSNKVIVVKGTPKAFNRTELKAAAEALGAKVETKLTVSTDYYVMTERMYSKYIDYDDSEDMERARTLEQDGLTVLNEYDFLKLVKSFVAQ